MVQNFSSGFNSAPQRAQGAGTQAEAWDGIGVPQAVQKFTPGSVFAPQRGHIGSILARAAWTLKPEARPRASHWQGIGVPGKGDEPGDLGES